MVTMQGNSRLFYCIGSFTFPFPFPFLFSYSFSTREVDHGAGAAVKDGSVKGQKKANDIILCL